MKSRRIAIATTLFLYVFVFSLDAQVPQPTLVQPTPKAREQLTRALQEYRQKKDGRREAVTLLHLGFVEAGLGNESGARSNLIEAIEKMRAQNDFVGTWMGRVLLSQIESATGRHAEAVSRLEKALATLNDAKASNAPMTLDTFLAFGAIAEFPPEMRQMLDDPRTAPMMKSMMIQFNFEPMTQDLYGSALTQVGQLEKAETALKAAAAGSSLAQGMFDFSIESHFGDLRFRQQRYDEARTHYVKALNASAKTGGLLPTGDQPIKAGIYDRLVRLETVTGHPEAARRWSDKARELVKKPSGAR
jgi:tetratricopeptide (TPR) repeat protein